jgi:SAM-dependent methyltransferase
MATREERGTQQRFAERYRREMSDVPDQIEQVVIGGNWGANGYTTLQQADHLASVLHLDADARLLDLGAGRGWPGLYLAASTGCHAALCDVPLEALRSATTRVEVEQVSDRVDVVAASARALPFAPRTFDAVVHTDVLC